MEAWLFCTYRCYVLRRMFLCCVRDVFVTVALISEKVVLCQHGVCFHLFTAGNHSPWLVRSSHPFVQFCFTQVTYGCM